jgi:hypothetical protein
MDAKRTRMNCQPRNKRKGSARVSRASSGVAPELLPHIINTLQTENDRKTRFSARRRKRHARGVCSPESIVGRVTPCAPPPVASAILADVEPGFQPGGIRVAIAKSSGKIEPCCEGDAFSGRQDAALHGRPGGPPLLFKQALNRIQADERERNKRRDAENAERRREFLFALQSLDDVLSAASSTLRFSAAFAPRRLSPQFSSAFVRLSNKATKPFPQKLGSLVTSLFKPLRNPHSEFRI